MWDSVSETPIMEHRCPQSHLNLLHNVHPKTSVLRQSLLCLFKQDSLGRQKIKNCLYCSICTEQGFLAPALTTWGNVSFFVVVTGYVATYSWPPPTRYRRPHFSCDNQKQVSSVTANVLRPDYYYRANHCREAALLAL